MSKEDSPSTDPEAESTTGEVEPQTAPATHKVLGELSTQDATGVLGRNTATTGVNHGVWGRTDSEDHESSGVHGEATATSGRTYGVDGYTESGDPQAAGVRGSSIARTYGVDGRVYDDEAALPRLGTLESAGVIGRTDKSSGWGVVGWSSNDIGVLGRSDDPNSPGIWGVNGGGGDAIYANGAATVDGDHSVTGNASVTGSQSVGTVGLSVYRNFNQTVANRTSEIVLFNRFRHGRDDFGGYDTNTGKYTVQEDGDYHVDVGIKWKDNFTDGALVQHQLEINDSRTGGIQIDRNLGGADDLAISFSKTLFGLVVGDTVHVNAWFSDSISSNDIFGHADGITYMTIHKVG